jgi:hypothetical protein
MKFICKYNCECCDEGENEIIAVEATSNEQVKRFIYDFIFEPHSDKSDIQCEIVTFDHKNEEHLNVLKGQGGIFWEV